MQLRITDRLCPLCGSSDQSNVFAEANVDVDKLDGFAFASRKLPEYMHWRLIECQACDLLYSSPAPEPSALFDAYDQAAFDSAAEARYAALTYGGFLPGITRKLKKLDGALDIGTGDGAFLHELLRAGFSRVLGVEPSSAPITAAAPEVRDLIRHGMFDAGSFEPESFSLITCFQTFEHLADPLAMCRDAYRLLRPGGAVYFIGHNRRSFSAALMGRKSPIFDIEHLQLFSPASVKYMLTAAKFVDVKAGSFLNRYPISYWTKLFPMPAGLKAGFLRVLRASRIGQVAIPLPAGNLFVIGYKPLS